MKTNVNEPTLTYKYGNNEKESPQAPDMFNPKVSAQTCGIIQKVYETKQNTTLGLIKSVVGGFSEIQSKMSK